MAKDKVVTNIKVDGEDFDDEEFEVEFEDDNEDLELPQGGPDIEDYEDEEDEEDEENEEDEEDQEEQEDPRLQQLLSKNTQLAEQLKEQRNKYKELRTESTKYKKTSLEAQKTNLDSTIKTLKENLVQLRKQGDPDSAEQEIEVSTQLQDAMLKRTVLDYQDVEDTEDDTDTDTEDMGTQDDLGESPDTTQQRIPKAAREWAKKNTWYRENPEDAAVAGAIADTMIRGGWNPSNESFYNELDTRLAKRNIGVKVKQRERSKPTVAGPSQNPRPKRRVVRLSPEQRYAADSLGIDYKTYARRLRDMESKRDGKYTNIF